MDHKLGCGDVITQSWDGESSADAMDKLLGRIESCAVGLSHWNMDHFGNVTQEIKWLGQKLKLQTDARSRRVILAKIREWKRKEEILWW